MSNRTSEVVLATEEVERVYRIDHQAIHALSRVTLEVRDGEKLCIMGESGAGKSTLLHLLGGLDRPSSGRVLLNGQNLYELPASKRASIRANDIGFVFQSYHLLPELDVLENVLLPAMSCRGFLARRDMLRGRALELLERVGLSERTLHLPSELSGGEQQRAALARALMNDPSIVLADEPTGNLDSRTGKHVLDYLFRLVNEQSRTLLIVTHNERIAEMCDRTLVLKDGTLLE
ncbi:MAG: ABC transporter ATP-binding protein [Verrucomicrobia bacterium]|nr:ABC transporter ATP-binding protein [Verrucomicrobiota bacterium]